MKELSYFLVDVFTDSQFGGNPLAVFRDGSGLNSEVMQKIAKELNLSETTFILPPDNKKSDCKVRIFTPAAELPMAGHPTIGTAFVLLSNQLIKPKHKNHLLFDLGVGPVKVSYTKKEDKGLFITMEQPLPHFGHIYEQKDEIADILSLPPEAISLNLPVQCVSCGNPIVIVPIITLEAIKKAKVRVDLLEKYLLPFDSQLLYPFTMETVDPKNTVHSRLFAPLQGITEDPATGSASGPLGAYMVKYGLHDGSKIKNEQGIEMGRPSTIHIEIKLKDQEVTKVKVSGNSVAIGKGKFKLFGL